MPNHTCEDDETGTNSGRLAASNGEVDAVDACNYAPQQLVHANISKCSDGCVQRRASEDDEQLPQIGCTQISAHTVWSCRAASQHEQSSSETGSTAWAGFPMENRDSDKLPECMHAMRPSLEGAYVELNNLRCGHDLHKALHAGRSIAVVTDHSSVQSFACIAQLRRVSAAELLSSAFAGFPSHLCLFVLRIFASSQVHGTQTFGVSQRPAPRPRSWIFRSCPRCFTTR